MIRKMKRIYIFHVRSWQDKLLQHLQKLGVLQIEEVDLPEASGQPAHELADVRGEVESLLIKARGILELFREANPALLKVSVSWPEGPTRLEELAQAFRRELEPLEVHLRELVSERRQIQERLAAIERFREILHASEELLPKLPQEGRHILAVIGERHNGQLLMQIHETLQAMLPKRYALESCELSEDRLLILVSVEPDYAEAVREYLEAKGLRPLVLPAHVGGDLLKGLAQMRWEEANLPKRMQEIERDLVGIAQRHVGRLIPLAAALENRLAQLEAALKFSYTDFTLLISGWVPADEFPRFQEALKREFPGIVIAEDPQPASHDEIPVAFSNPSWARPYQLFLELVGLPRYGTVDPSFTMSLFFPVFVGLIIGDFGYGLVLFILSLLGLRRWGGRSELIRGAFTIGLQASGLTIVFGALFGEFFGFVMPWPHFARLESARSFLIFTVALGAVQILLGFLLGAINALRARSKKHLMAKVGSMLLLLMIGMLVGTLAGLLPQTLRTPGIALLVASLVLLLYGEGFMGLLEVFSYVGHVISYARIMGFGIAAVVLTELVNDLAGAMGNIVLGLLVGIVLHAVHLVLDVFESSIQSARLHLVEFFTKFYEAGGRHYEPFRELVIIRSKEET